MSFEKDWSVRLQDIHEAASAIINYTSGINLDKLADDPMRFDAIVRNFQVIGEAARKIPPDVRRKIPELPWRSMTGMRDILVHNYDEINVRILTQTIREDVPKLIRLVETVLARWNE